MFLFFLKRVDLSYWKSMSSVFLKFQKSSRKSTQFKSPTRKYFCWNSERKKMWIETLYWAFRWKRVLSNWQGQKVHKHKFWKSGNFFDSFLTVKIFLFKLSNFFKFLLIFFFFLKNCTFQKKKTKSDQEVSALCFDKTFFFLVAVHMLNRSQIFHSCFS